MHSESLSQTTFDDLAHQLVALPGSHVIVAVDGPGGAGKSTFADRLVAASNVETTLLHTDEFARPDQPIAWWPRLQAVIESLAAGHPSSFEPYNWTLGSVMATRTVVPTPLMIIEGVSSSRSEWANRLAFSIWIEADAPTCRRRGTHRDGIEPAPWDAAAASEADFFLRDGTRHRADMIVDSSDTTGVDAADAFVHQSTKPQ